MPKNLVFEFTFGLTAGLSLHCCQPYELAQHFSQTIG